MYWDPALDGVFDDSYLLRWIKHYMMPFDAFRSFYNMTTTPEEPNEALSSCDPRRWRYRENGRGGEAADNLFLIPFEPGISDGLEEKLELRRRHLLEWPASC